jgi:hypothetical protein
MVAANDRRLDHRFAQPSRAPVGAKWPSAIKRGGAVPVASGDAERVARACWPAELSDTDAEC